MLLKIAKKLIHDVSRLWAAYNASLITDEASICSRRGTQGVCLVVHCCVYNKMCCVVAAASRIHLSEAASSALREFSGYLTEFRGETFVKVIPELS